MLRMSTEERCQSLRTGRLELPAICLGNALGGCGSGTIPLWVAATVGGGLLSTSRVGWLASGELFSMAISALAVSAWGQRASPRAIAAVTASVAVVGNVVAMFPTADTLVIGRLLSGLAMGALQASVTGVAVRRPDGQRALALMQAAFVLLASVVILVFPDLVGRFGVAGLFGIFAGVGLIMLVASLIGLPVATISTTVATRARSPLKLPPILGCLALGIMILGVNSVWVYIIAIGNALGIDAHTLGVVLAVVLPLSMLGPLAAHRIGERVGLLRPLVFGLALMAMDVFFLVSSASPVLFCITTSALIMLGFFCVPYAVALLSRLDASGRFASAAPAFMMIGNAIAPALSGKLAGAARFEALAVLACSCMALSVVLFSVSAGLGHVKVALRDGGKAG
jgi:predicted MFS family arabinose efflux permease